MAATFYILGCSHFFCFIVLLFLGGEGKVFLLFWFELQ